MFVFTALPGGGLSTLVDVALNAVDRFTRNFAAVQDVASIGARDSQRADHAVFGGRGGIAGDDSAQADPHVSRRAGGSRPGEFGNAGNPGPAGDRGGAAGDDHAAQPRTRSRPWCGCCNTRFRRPRWPRRCWGCSTSGWCASCARLAARPIRPPPKCSSRWECRPARSKPFSARRPSRSIRSIPTWFATSARGSAIWAGRRIFELLTVDDTLREALASNPKLENLRLTARRAGHRALQEEGLLLVARGVTSLQELLRVLKQ